MKISVVSAAQPAGDVADAAAGAQRLGLLDVLQLDAERLPVAEVAGEDAGLVGRPEHDVCDAGVADAREQVREERNAGRGQHRLRRGQRQWAQPGTETADQDDRVHAAGAGVQGVLGFGRAPAATAGARRARAARVARPARSTSRTGAHHRPG